MSLAGLLLAVIALQYKAWFGDVGYFSNSELSAEVTAQQQRTDVLRLRNRILTAEVLALQRGDEAVESRARENLGMVKEDEDFFIFDIEQR